METDIAKNFKSRFADADHFETLVAEYYPKILYHSLKKVRDMHSAEEITQETFLKAFINFGKLKDRSSFGPWLFSICGNEIGQNYRNTAKNSRAKSVFNEIIPRVSNENDDSFIQNERLNQAFFDLSETHRELIAFKYFCGFSLKQISLLTGANEKSIKSRLYEARSRLFKLMNSTSENSGLQNIILSRRKIIMDKIKLMQAGAHVFSRLSLKAQLELLELARTNEKFSGTALLEIGAAEKGREFVAECGGKLTEDEITLIISFCDEETIKRIRWEQHDKNNNFGAGISGALKKHSLNGYIVSGVDVMLKAVSVDKTLEWYEKVLGWKAHKGMFDENGACCYGCVTLDDKDPIVSGTRGFHGFHIGAGGDAKTAGAAEKGSGVLPMITVDGLENLKKRIEKSGWKEYSGIEDEGFGANTLTIKDLNGYTIKFLEWPENIKNPYSDQQ